MKIPEGFLFSAIHCGLKRKKLDLGLIEASKLASACGFFTSNVNQSYSVVLSKKNIKKEWNIFPT